ncbi:hypothetical protein JDW15_06130 [Aerococcaceae bacterium zg-ZJ1578]|uniref:hypothetical protein n=1 Tax=Aerococcaceae bacterium zg-252 TaxID=2796928 RepID=UPI001A243B4E|nr:hypothetical protein [Aerococcaceae bacterium zg-1578]
MTEMYQIVFVCDVLKTHYAQQQIYKTEEEAKRELIKSGYKPGKYDWFHHDDDDFFNRAYVNTLEVVE